MGIMKKGKIFGVFNFLDIAIIAILLVLILPMLHYYMRFNERGMAEQMALDRFVRQQMRENVGFQVGYKSGKIDVEVSFKNIRKEDLAKIKVGDKEATPNGTVLAEILRLGEPAPNYFIADLGEPPRCIPRRTAKDSLYSIPAKLRVSGIISDQGSFSFKTKPLKQFRIYTFNSGKYDIDFVVEEPLSSYRPNMEMLEE